MVLSFVFVAKKLLLDALATAMSSSDLSSMLYPFEPQRSPAAFKHLSQPRAVPEQFSVYPFSPLGVYVWLTVAQLVKNRMDIIVMMFFIVTSLYILISVCETVIFGCTESNYTFTSRTFNISLNKNFFWFLTAN